MRERCVFSFEFSGCFGRARAVVFLRDVFLLQRFSWEKEYSADASAKEVKSRSIDWYG